MSKFGIPTFVKKTEYAQQPYNFNFPIPCQTHPTMRDQEAFKLSPEEEISTYF